VTGSVFEGAPFDVAATRGRFSSLRDGFAFLDAPGGTQVPDEVADAVRTALIEGAGNLGAPYRTGRVVEGILERAKADGGRFLGCSPGAVSFGTNMTTLNFALSRVAGRELREGDEIVTTQLDHDGGVAPWVELAEDRGLVVRVAEAADDLTVDYGEVERLVGDRTRVLAFAWASNATGAVADAARLCRLAREAGALSWIDAVHYAAHEPIDVEALGCDVLVCSPYKFCGPHLGLAYVREELAARWRPYKARPSPAMPTGRRFETGTLPYELLAGFSATVAYLDSLGGIAALREHERELGARLLAGLPESVTLYGPPTLAGRVPTFLLEVDGVPAERAARTLGEQGIGVWYAADWYCVSLAPRLPASTLRAGLIHYNTADEVDRFLAALAAL
jgi:cysteine desulfurase family protein (TIGR01976 family)